MRAFYAQLSSSLDFICQKKPDVSVGTHKMIPTLFTLKDVAPALLRLRSPETMERFTLLHNRSTSEALESYTE